MRKDFTVDEAAEKLKLTHSVGIKTFISLIVGFPHENATDVDDTISFIKKNAGHIDGVYSLNPILIEKDSPLYKNPEEFKIENLRPEYGALSRKYFSFDEVDGMKWRQRLQQQRKAYSQILRTVYYNIFKKSPFPFWVWFLKRNYEVKREPFKTI